MALRALGSSLFGEPFPFLQDSIEILFPQQTIVSHLQEFPGWNSKPALYPEIKERQREMEHSRLVGGRFNKKGIYKVRLWMAARWVDLCSCHHNLKSLYRCLSWAQSSILTRQLVSSSWVSQHSCPLDDLLHHGLSLTHPFETKGIHLSLVSLSTSLQPCTARV